MRIRRIEALRFGALQDQALSGLGDGLNVVFGPNESGKSTYTALVRHLIYGYPDRRRSERHYESAAGARAGRIEFDVDGEVWTLERVDGKGGGEPVVIGPNGPHDAAEFLARVRGAVTEDVYRTVFGFGLAELTELNSLQSINSHFHATVAGLSVNPRDAYVGLEKEAAELFRPGGSAQPVPRLVRQLTDTRKEIRAARTQAEGARADREHLRDLEQSVQEAEETLLAARSMLAKIDTARAGIDRMLAERETLERDEIPEAERALDAAQARADAISVDEEALGRLAELGELAARLEVFEAARSELAAVSAQHERLKAEATAAIDRIGQGWTEDSVEGVPAGGHVEDAVEMCVTSYRIAADAHGEAEREARMAGDREKDARERAVEAIALLGLSYEAGASSIIDHRIEAADRLLADSAPTRRAGVLPVVLASVLAFSGAGLAGWSFWREDWLSTGVGGLILFLAILLVSLMARRGRSANVDTFLDVLGLREVPSGAEMLDLKQRLYAARDAVKADDSASSQAVEAERSLADALDEVVAARTACREQLGSLGLQWEGDDPTAVPSILRRVREAQEVLRHRKSASEQEIKLRAQCRAFVHRASQTGVAVSDDDDPAEIPALVRLEIERSREAAKRTEARDQIMREVSVLHKEILRMRERLEGFDVRIREGVESAGVEGAITAADLRVASESTLEEVSRLQARTDELRDERSRLAERLSAVADDDSVARLSLVESATMEELRVACERYAVKKVAAHLMESTLRRYERERQPAVVARAAEMFSRITQGRYGEVLTPLGEFELTVRGEGVAARGEEHLSTATAEQLYLTLRLAYLEGLVGPEQALPVVMDDVFVNFDERRRLETARIIAEFARNRQVIVFSCQESTLEACEAAAPGHTRVNLERC